MVLYFPPAHSMKCLRTKNGGSSHWTPKLVTFQAPTPLFDLSIVRFQSRLLCLGRRMSLVSSLPFLYWCPALPCFGRKEHHRRGPVHPRSLHISRRKPASNAVCPITLYMFVFGSKIILSLWLSSYCYCNSILTLISSVEVYQPFLRRSIASSVGKREKKRETLSVWRVLWAFVLLFFHPPSFVAIRNNVMRFVLVFPHQFPRSHTQSIVASYSVASDPYLQHKH